MGCVVLVPVASQIEPETLECLSVLIDRGYKVQTLRGCSQVDLARSSLASDALRAGFTETMWIDSDIVFRPDDVELLRAHNKPIAAGLYVKKGKPEFAAHFKTAAPATFGKGGGLLEMQYVGMGFTLIRSNVYQVIEQVCKLPRCTGGYDPAKPIVPYFLPTVVQKDQGANYLSEDFSFCERAAQAGFKSFADTTIKLGHAGRTIYTWDDLPQKQRYDWIQVGFEVNNTPRTTSEQGGGSASCLKKSA